MAKQFWMVKGVGPSSVTHTHREDAESEAQRLVKLHPGQSFFIMEAITLYRKVDVERVDLRADDDDRIPS